MSSEWLNAANPVTDGYSVTQRLLCASGQGGADFPAHFKLEQIDKRFRIVNPNSVLELGAAPGGWTHYLEEASGRVIDCC